MELLIDNTDRVTDAIRAHFENKRSELKNGVLDEIETRRQKARKQAHTEGKKRLEQDKVSIDKRLHHKYNLQKSSLSSELRDRKKQVYDTLQERVKDKIEEDADLQKKILRYVEEQVANSSGEEDIAIVEGKTFVETKAEVETDTKRYTVTVQEVVTEILAQYWADIAPDVRL